MNPLVLASTLTVALVVVYLLLRARDVLRPDATGRDHRWRLVVDYLAAHWPMVAALIVFVPAFVSGIEDRLPPSSWLNLALLVGGPVCFAILAFQPFEFRRRRRLEDRRES